MLRILARSFQTPMRISVGAKKYSAAVVLLDKEQTIPEWLRISKSAAEDLDQHESVWVYDDASGYGRTLVKKLKKKTYAEDPTSVFKSANETVKALQGKKLASGDVYLPSSFTADLWEKWANTAVLSGYSFSRKTHENPEEKPVPVTELNCVNPPSHDSARLERVLKSAEAALYSRDLGNLRGSEAAPDMMIEKVKTLIASHGSLPLTMEIISGEDLAKRGLGMMYAVGKGAVSPPSLVWVSYKGDPEHTDKLLSFVGKGLTFDTGGLNLKKTGHIETMYLDKSGACAGLGVLKWVLETRAKVNLSLGLGFVENAIGSRSYKPKDILTSLKGLTVEVNNTDAEGRLVLGDALTFVQRKQKPSVMIDFATLTGACIVALGDDTAGILGNCEQLIGTLKKAGEAVDERIWSLPISEEDDEGLKSEAADISNLGEDKYAGAGEGAAFLRNFVEKDVKWAHIDIAGPAMRKKEKQQFSAGCTAFGTQLLTRFIMDHW